MKNFNAKTILKMTGALAALMYFTACGSNITQSGFGAANLSSTSNTTANSAVATCSKDMSNVSDFQIRVEAAYDSFGAIQTGYARVQIVASPADWSTSNYDLQLYRWAAVTNGSTTSTNMDSAALYFQFEKTAAPGYYVLLTDSNGNAPSYPIINASEMTSYAQTVGLSYSSPQVVMNQAHLLVNLRDTTGAYQVIRAVLRDKSTGAVVRQVDALIPTFYANPATYNAQLNSAGQPAHPSILQVLHPLQAYLGQGWTEAQYQSFMNGFCF
jgi:hypothetical protein